MPRGISEPFTFSNKSAGPPDFMTGSLKAVISRLGSTSSLMRFREPFCSKRLMNFAVLWGADIETSSIIAVHYTAF